MCRSFLPRLALAVLACATVWLNTTTRVGAEARTSPILAGALAANASPSLQLVTLPKQCELSTGLCYVVFYGVQPLPPNAALGPTAPITNLYICGVDVFYFDTWYGRLQQNIYASYGWSNVGWKVDASYLTTSAVSLNHWASLSGPNPSDPWGTVTVDEHVNASGWLLPFRGYHWVDAHFAAGGGFSCAGN